MLVEILLVVVIFIALMAAVLLVYRHMERVAAVPEQYVVYAVGARSFWHEIIRFVAGKQKIVTAAVLTKVIRRLKIISLKTDNISSSLLQKLERERHRLKKRD